MAEREPIKVLTVTILSDGKRIMSEITRANGMKDDLVITVMEEWLANFKSKVKLNNKYGKASK